MSGSGEPSAIPPAPPQAPARILVVDDEVLNVKLLEGHLLPLGYEVVTAGTGEEALAALAERPVDLILLDVMMPGLDGFEVTQRLRANPATRLLPIVLITALKDTEYRIRGISAGCDDFISKPFDKQEVLARIRALLRINYYRSLLDEKEKFEEVIDRIDDGIVVLDGALRPARVNRRAADLLGLDPAAPLPDLLEHLVRRFRVALDGDLRRDIARRPLAFDVERPESDTTQPLLLAARSSVIRDPEGCPSSIVVTLRDVTEERLEQLMKRDFLSLISHKLRTPLTVILSHATMLQEGTVGAPLTQDQQALADGIAEKAQALGRLVNRLLLFTALRAERVSRPAEPVRLRASLSALLDRLAEAAKPKRIVWRLDCQDPDAAVLVRPAHLEVILDNLVENAVKFHGKDTLQLTVSVTRAGEQMELAVSDDGPGIPPEDRERIFQLFYQVERFFTGNVEGAGLGLPLVQHLVTAYGGTVRLRSELGRGTTVVCTLPAAPGMVKASG